MEWRVTKREKLIARIVARPPTARFSDVRALLEDFGYSLDRTKGSHHTFVRTGEFPIVVPVHDKTVKRVYLVAICERLGIGSSETADAHE
jgi:predicted RNA binding protein YcfA (HicA-like mRNA interferase family)